MYFFNNKASPGDCNHHTACFETDFDDSPGGKLKPGEDDISGLKRKLNAKLGTSVDSENPEVLLDWDIGDHVATWWRPDFDVNTVNFLSLFRLGLRLCVLRSILTSPLTLPSQRNSEDCTLFISLKDVRFLCPTMADSCFRYIPQTSKHRAQGNSIH
jgi:hypothetical protein